MENRNEQEKKNLEYKDPNMGSVFMILGMVWFILSMTNEENPWMYVSIGFAFLTIGFVYTPWENVWLKASKSEESPKDSQNTEEKDV